MESNCLMYVPALDKLIAGHLDDDGIVYILNPGHGGGYYSQLSQEFLKAFNITVYPG